MGRVITQRSFPIPIIQKRKRVAAYARVSSGKDAMLHSLSAQVSFYSELIQRQNEWEYAGVYADEALTGTKDTRENFQRMIADCRSGKIDMVITKSISRFARNTVTLLDTVRELKQLGVDVYFEEQNIHTMSADGELLLTILASYAQEESRSASENQKWRVRMNFKAGLPWTGTLLGYRKEEGVFTPNEEEAAVVRMIFHYYLSGLGYSAIAKKLNAQGIHTRFGNEWDYNSLVKLIRNYTYTGNLILQKTFVENHITKKKRINTGQLPKYHVENAHEAIIPLEEFNEVQEERKARAMHYGNPSGKYSKYPFTSKLVCKGCGRHYRRKTVAKGPVWICSTFNTKGKSFCPTSKQIPEGNLMQVCAAVLKAPGFDAAAFEKQVKEIQVGPNNALTFVMHDGKTVETTWQSSSRADSWDDEKREAARQAALLQEPLSRGSNGRFQKRESDG